jgi:hypothetical protein
MAGLETRVGLGAGQRGRSSSLACSGDGRVQSTEYELHEVGVLSYDEKGKCFSGGSVSEELLRGADAELTEPAGGNLRGTSMRTRRKPHFRR